MPYILDSRGDAERRRRERDRLDVLDAAVGPWTMRLLRERGIERGWRCLDVGAGAGHLSRWLAAQGASVVATDVDTALLDDVGDAAIDVRRQDILDGPAEGSVFDLVVARAVIVHLADRPRALRHMAASLRPGGWLVVVDPSLPQTPRVERAADRQLHDRVFALWSDFLVEQGLEWDAAQSAALLEGLGMEAGGEGLVQLLRGGTAPARLWSLTLAASAPPLIERGVLDSGEVDAVVTMMDDPGYRARQLVGYAAWGRAPTRQT
ncbi:MAG TPA: class I SAM-dependent methyltransferase [Solirubrobacteraceae bacterium]|jgi:SAM-dependent methyltransferase